ncbi:MAG: PIN domain-containing protein [Deltaproteobacteria bacterium]|jgi:predicted nucleic-acid-binding protein|nr:PIN domain-containing protein [Deltaproteobacteria bacterium]MDA8305128.1 PIN domain-containing protein [Deltaproteobacteria bacterium]
MTNKTIKIVDTNVILRYLLNDNEEQFKIVKSFFDNVKTGRMRAVILESVIFETVYVLLKVYKIPKKEIADTLKDLLSFKGVINKDAGRLIDALSYYNIYNDLSLLDCFICVKSKELKIDMLSFDKNLHKKCDR